MTEIVFENVYNKISSFFLSFLPSSFANTNRAYFHSWTDKKIFFRESWSQVFFQFNTCLSLKRRRCPYREEVITGMQRGVSFVSAGVRTKVTEHIYSDKMLLPLEWIVNAVHWTLKHFHLSHLLDYRPALVLVVFSVSAFCLLIVNRCDPWPGVALPCMTHVSHMRRQGGQLIQRWMREVEAFLQGWAHFISIDFLFYVFCHSSCYRSELPLTVPPLELTQVLFFCNV